MNFKSGFHGSSESGLQIQMAGGLGICAAETPSCVSKQFSLLFEHLRPVTSIVCASLWLRSLHRTLWHGAPLNLSELKEKLTGDDAP